jgi:hypothetical protein
MAIESAKNKKIRTEFNMVKGRGITRNRLIEISKRTNDEFLLKLASGEIGFVKVKNIEPLGIKETYDFSVPPYGNFVANGFIVHNTANIEQTCDKAFGLWYPIKSEPWGTDIELVLGENSRKAVKVTKNLLIARLLKQKLGDAPKTFPLFVDPEKNYLGMMM